MKITVDEMVDMQNRTTESIHDAYKRGVEDEKERALPDNLFESLLKYGKESETLIDYSKSTSKSDGSNWIQLKPTRGGSEGVKQVEISFEENLMEIHYIGIGLTE